MSGPIRIAVLADTKDLRSGLGGAEKSLKKMETTAKKAGAGVDSAMSGVNDSVDSTASNASVLAGAFGDVAGGLGLIGLGGFSDELEAAAPALMLVAGAADIASVAMNTLSLSKIKDTAATIANKTASLASAAAAKAQAIAQWALNAALSANPIGLIIIALVALVAGLVLAYKKSETFRNIVNAAFGAVKTVVQSVANFFISTVPAAFQTIVNAAKNVLGWVKSNWKTILAFLTGPIGLAVRAITSNWDKITEGAKSAYNGVKTWLGKALSFITSLPGKIKGAFTGVWDGLAGGLKSAINSVLHLPLKIPEIDTHIPGVGKVGGQTLIPALARGGITTGPTVAMIGDNPGGREAVIPLDRYDLSGDRLVALLSKILAAVEHQTRIQSDGMTSMHKGVVGGIYDHARQQRSGAGAVARSQPRGRLA